MSRHRPFEPTHSPDALRAIARYQRLLILCLLAQLFVWAGYILLTVLGVVAVDEDAEVLVFVMGLTALLGLVGGVVVFLLATKVSGPVLGVIFGGLTVVPCLGLVMLLIVNVQATGVLQAHGVRVGLIGARGSDLDALRDGYEVEEDEGW
ncbi:MAG: hypothetical protein JWO38_4738 [Gemmataceae bacterium]|nr:hypothetical protein [Gemmataceae bacterium]